MDKREPRALGSEGCRGCPIHRVGHQSLRPTSASDAQLRFTFVNRCSRSLLGLPQADPDRKNALGKSPRMCRHGSREGSACARSDQNSTVSFENCFAPWNRLVRITAMPDAGGRLSGSGFSRHHGQVSTERGAASPVFHRGLNRASQKRHAPRPASATAKSRARGNAGATTRPDDPALHNHRLRHPRLGGRKIAPALSKAIEATGCGKCRAGKKAPPTSAKDGAEIPVSLTGRKGCGAGWENSLLRGGHGS